MEIAPGVHQVPILGADAFVLTGERLTLIDAGMVGSRRALDGYLRRIGRDIAEVDHIICTHGHPDHIGGIREIVGARDDVTVWMHPEDIAGLRVTLRNALDRRADGPIRRGRLIDFLTPAPSRCEPLADGTVLDVAGGLRVIHTPGHTPGSICLYGDRHRILFTGDVLEVRRGRLRHANPFFSHDLEQSRASVGRLLELDVTTIAFSHYPPWRDDPNRALRRLARQGVTGVA